MVNKSLYYLGYNTAIVRAQEICRKKQSEIFDSAIKDGKVRPEDTAKTELLDEIVEDLAKQYLDSDDDWEDDEGADE